MIGLILFALGVFAALAVLYHYSDTAKNIANGIVSAIISLVVDSATAISAFFDYLLTSVVGQLWAISYIIIIIIALYNWVVAGKPVR